LGSQRKPGANAEEAREWSYFDETDSILETDLTNLADDGRLKTLYIYDTEDGFYVTVLTNGNDEYFLSTRRERDTPRMFRNYERMSRMLKELAYDTDKVVIYE